MTLVAATSAIVLRQTTDHTTAILTLVGAVLVALIAAGTAQWRLRVQLKHERERLRQQLDHERSLNDLREVRHLLDQTAAHTQEATDLWIKLSVEVTRSSPRHEKVNDLVHRIELVGDALTSDGLKLDTRALSKAGDAVVGVREALDTLEMLNLGQRATANGAESVRADEDELLGALAKAAGAFYRAAKDIAAAKLPT